MRKVCKTFRTEDASRVSTYARPISILTASMARHNPDCVSSPMCSAGIRMMMASGRTTEFATSSR
ncbi:hypothetical protein D3C71_1830960 [compost metagenome]